MGDILKQTDYRSLLWNVFQKRSSKNPGYSQRAFARDLGMRSGRLSEVLRGKQGLSCRYAKRIGDRLGLSKPEAEYFLDLVAVQSARSPAERTAAEARLRAAKRRVPYRLLDDDQFKLISDWYHLAILQLSRTIGFQSSALWIAETLDVPVREIKEALARLERLGFLNRNTAPWEFRVVDTYAAGGVPSAAIRHFHRQILDKAKAALQGQPVDRRDFSAVLIALDRRRLDEIKERIVAFWKAMDEEFGEAGVGDDVYCLSVQCFALTKGSAHA